MELKIKLIDEQKFLLLREQWNALLRESSNNEFFLTWEWISTWWKVYGESKNNKKLFILAVEDGDRNLIGIAPWYIRKEKVLKLIPLKKIYFLGIGENVSPEYLNIIIKKGWEDDVISNIRGYLLKNKYKWDLLYLSDITENHLITEKIKEVFSAENIPFFREKIIPPCLYFMLPQSWEAMLKSLNKKHRYNIKSRRKKINENFNVEANFYIQKQVSQWLLDILLFLHNRRMNDKGIEGKFRYNDYRSFHTKLIKNYPQYVIISLMKIDSKPAAVRYGYIYDNKVYNYQTGFDPKYKKYGVGQVLLSYLIEKCIKKGFREFDFLRGAEPYKYDWTNLERWKERIIIFNPYTWRGKVVYFYFLLKRITKTNIRRFIKGSSWILIIIKRIIGTLIKFIYYKRTSYMYMHNLKKIPQINCKLKNLQIDFHDKPAEMLKDICVIKKAKPHKFLKRFKRKHICVTAEYNRELAFFNWISIGEWSLIDGRYNNLNDSEFFIYDAYTIPEYRRNGIWQSMLATELRVMKEKGYKGCYVLVEENNLPSIKGIEKVGFEKIGKVKKVKVLGLKIIRKENGDCRQKEGGGGI